jgi:hypothetical protein
VHQIDDETKLIK